MTSVAMHTLTPQLTSSHAFSITNHRQRQHRVVPSSSTSPLITKSNHLLSGAAKSSQPLNKTLKLFRLLPAKDTVTWNTVMSACLRAEDPHSALTLFVEMLEEFLSMPDDITLRLVFAACSELCDCSLLCQLHAYVIKMRRRFCCSVGMVLDTCLMNGYSRCGRFDICQEVFGEMPQRDVVAFTSMLMGYLELCRWSEALEVFIEMMEMDEIAINEYACSCALRACAGARFVSVGRQVHAYSIKSMMGSNMFVGTGIVDLYAKCGEMTCARIAFAEIVKPSVISWNALMAGDLDGGECLMLLDEMMASGFTPDHVTYANVLRTCKKGVTSQSIKQVHGLVLKTVGSNLDTFVGSALFEAYADSGLFSEALMSFHQIGKKDDVAFNLAIQACVKNGYGAEALNLYHGAVAIGKEVSEVTMMCLLERFRGLKQGKCLHSLALKFGYGDGGNRTIFGPLLKMYAENYEFSDAIRLFEQIDFPDLILWTLLISSLSRSGEHKRALHMYVKMVAEGLVEPPNHFTFSTVLSSCAHLVAMDEGRQIHAQILKSDAVIKSDPFVMSSLIYLYAKCGYIEEAGRFFSQIQDPDLASWNVLISSLAEHGFSEKVIATFEELLKQKDLEPNDITYVGVLTACARFGMVEMAYKYFRMIKEPTIDHYACLINVLARAGLLNEAMDLIETMPFQANELIWSSVLAACSIHGNIELGELSAVCLLKMNPKDPATYVTLSNVYTTAGRWKDAYNIRKLMEAQGDEKYPGMSWLNLNKKTYTFKAGSKVSMHKHE